MKPNFAEVLIHPEDYARERLLRTKYARLSDDAIVESEYRWKHKAGGCVWLNTRKMVYERGTDGQITQILSVIRDVTARKEAEEQRQKLLAQLQQANQQLSDFAYVISHDLKAPLRGVSSVAEWLGSGYEDQFDAEGRELIQLLRGRVRRMQDMINGVLEYSRIGRELETSIPINVGVLVRQIVQDIVPAERIRVTIEDGPPTPLIEPTRIRQIFQNLIDNAIKFMDKPDGEIHIGCTNDGESWRFAVQDNGPGIAPHHFERIFQLFHAGAPGPVGQHRRWTDHRQADRRVLQWQDLDRIDGRTGNHLLLHPARLLNRDTGTTLAAGQNGNG
ncbi:MAG: PAS domain-containing protein [Chloroflexi bacterium]|nr:PAS domain-containing protein [Chloroflexota bacterium]